ncbi:MAG TPA: hypothetical protein VFT87_03170 [Candidatus Saccharimonadales bacterium]|nr:hypothetical protein [Candidatus Saccharimonadales bacterium]
MLAETQIGGKYDKTDQSLFSLKRRLQDADVRVRYPASDGIVCTIDGRGYTFDPRTTSFFDIETDYYRSIAETDFHTVNNRFLRHMGYIGASAALEMTYAMLHRRPILLMHPPVFAPTVEPFCAEVIDERTDLLHVHDMAQMNSPEIAETVSSIKGSGVEYKLSAKMGKLVLSRVEQLFEEIQNQ